MSWRKEAVQRHTHCFLNAREDFRFLKPIPDKADLEYNPTFSDTEVLGVTRGYFKPQLIFYTQHACNNIIAGSGEGGLFIW